MTLKELQIGKSAVVDTVGGSGALRQHFLDMGLIPGVEVTLVKLAPMGDPMELRIHGYELTLRLDDAAQIGITPTEKAPAMSAAPADDKMVDHPGLGEGGFAGLHGEYRLQGRGRPIPVVGRQVVPEKLRTLDHGRPWSDDQFASTRLSSNRDMSR